MSIKDDKLYPIFISYLENKKLNPGYYELSKISKVAFDRFIYKYENHTEFKNNQDNIYKSIKRDFLIGEILEDKNDFEIFLDDLDMITSKDSIDIDDNLFDF